MNPAIGEPRWLRWLLCLLALAVLGVVMLLPLAAVFTEALRRGLPPALAALADPDALAAVRLTLLVAAVAVPVNTLGGIAAAWAIANRVPRQAAAGHADRPALLGLPGHLGPGLGAAVRRPGLVRPWLQARGIEIVFALPGLVLATIFVTFPFVARTLIPLMQAQGRAEEEAAATLGASGWQIFRRVTLPNIRWALLSGVLLCNARAMGSSAPSRWSPAMSGETNTMPLHVEILYNEYQFVGAFAVAALLALLALVTLGAKALLERLGGRRLAGA
ncbi:ABC transporter permease subunit [Paeniroseomonas aquatica]|uniref:ABC transporter permease subunit n=1 Tax=Paeniroseomonas aquatica TaxID=373043 RepID=UPI0036074C7A